MKKIALFLLFITSIITTVAQEILKTEKIRRISFKESESTSPTIVSLEKNSYSRGNNLTARAGGSVAEGLTAGNLSVSPTGAAIYSIPITVPPGLQGVAPTLSINYNSQAGNGMAGYGWNVSGISVITRVGSTLYHDGYISEVNLTPTDRFALDGQRLMLKTGTYGKDGATYQTEVFSHLKIKSVGVSPYGANYGPLYFEVLYPDGSKAYYGQTNDSRSHTDYAISYWENPQGVRITYHYLRSGNAIVIQKITYGKQRTTGDNTVTFVYKNRTRPEVAYIGGVRFENNLLLEKIVSSSKGREFRTYTLNHGGKQNSLGYDRLMLVQESVGFSKREPIYFEYRNYEEKLKEKESEYQNHTFVRNISLNNSNTVSLDLDGDRLTDFILYPTTGDDAYKKIYLFDDFRKNSNNSFVFDVTLERFSEIFPAQILVGQNSNIYPDYQGFVSIHKYNDKIKFKTYVKGTTALVYPQYEREWELPIYYEEDREWCQRSGGYDPRKPIDVLELGTKKHAPVKILSGDFNGDGLTDILAVENSYYIESCHPRNEGHLTPHSNIDRRIHVHCDCNGYTSGGYDIHWIDLDKRKTTNFSKRAGTLSKRYGDRDIFQTVDITGNGKTNLIQITDGEMYVYEFDKDGYLRLLWKQSHSQISTSKKHITGDYNGDGKIDFLFPTANNSNRFVLFTNTGKGFDISQKDYEFTYREYYRETKTYREKGLFFGGGRVPYNIEHIWSLIPIDINGDGKTDIVESHSSLAPNRFKNEEQRSLTLYINTGGNVPVFNKVDYKTLSPNGFPHLIFSPSDKRDIYMDVSVVSGNKVETFGLEKNNKEDMLLRAVSQNDIVQNVTYKTMSENFSYASSDERPSDTYKTSYGEHFPYVDLGNIPSVSVVSKLERSGGGIPQAEQQFKYAGAVSNMQGLGFLGFKSIGKTNWYSKGKQYEEGIYTHTRMNPQLRGAITEELTLEDIHNQGMYLPTNYLQKTSYNYQNLTGNDKIFRLKLTQKNTEDKLTGVNSSESYIYDAEMNPTRMTTIAGTSLNTVETVYAPKSEIPYLVGRIASQKRSSTIDGDTFTTEEQFTYQNNLVTVKKIKGHNTGFKTERYTYDDVGNITRKDVVSESGETRTERMEYDSSKRFLTRHTSHENEITQYQHDDFSGVLLQEINHFRQTTRNTYDSWNRLIKTTDFLNKNAYVSYQATKSEYRITNSADDGSLSKEVYNWLGLLKRTEQRNAFGQEVIVENQYNGQGREIKRSLPYFRGSSTRGWITTSYDRYGRVIRITQPAGKSSQISYSGLTTTVNDGTKNVITTRNASGQTVKQQDPGGVITYTYFGNGNLKTADYQGAVQRITQDGWGRKTSLNDPSAGNYTYSYDAWDRITRETTPKGTTNYTYETGSDRIKQKHITGSGTDMRTIYTYNGDKLLSAIELQNADGNKENYTYTYNSHKQIASLTESKLNGQVVFIRNYTYDSFGRTQRETYTAKGYGKNVTANVLYEHNNGELITLKKASGEILWRLGAVNEYGSPLTVTKGKTTEQLQ
ncbi:FG-GAP-like repeat-containing protein, partial [Capnocytophaga cynodegmi]